jgi:hypothetical protein
MAQSIPPSYVQVPCQIPPGTENRPQDPDQGFWLARSRAELGATARLDGDIRSGALVVGLGAVFNGRSIMTDDASAMQQLSRQRTTASPRVEEPPDSA